MQTSREKDSFTSYIFFSGDGDFAYLYKYLIERGKQVVVMFAKGHAGRELRTNIALINIKSILMWDR